MNLGPEHYCRAPSVSVIVPTHRRPELLRRALDAAVQQTRAPAEIVVVDDADDVRSRDVVRSVAAHCSFPIRYIGYRGGSGVSMSRNIGVRESSGSAIALLDDDDYWDPQYLSNATQRLRDRQIDAVVTWRAGGLEGSLRDYRNPPERLTTRQVVASNPGVVGSNIVVRRAALVAIGGFDEMLPVSNDIDFFVRFLASGHGYAVIDAPLVFVGNARGPRLIDADPRRIAGMTRYLAKHGATMTRMQRLDYRRRILRVRLRMRRDLAAVRWRRILYTLGILALSKPEGRKDVQRVLALVRSA